MGSIADIIQIIISRGNSPVEEAIAGLEAKFNKSGISLYDQNGYMRSTYEILRDLAITQDDTEDEQIGGNVKPIILDTLSVQAILDGRKTMTRRVVKPQPSTMRWNNIGFLGWDDGHGYQIKQPYSVGDVLWVREKFTKSSDDYYYRADFEADTLDPCETLSGGYPESCRQYPGCEGCYPERREVRWLSPVTMPREAARLFLRVKWIRAERLQDISRADAIDEGFVNDGDWGAEVPFEDAWNELYDKRGYGWDTNPWVWVVIFNRCEAE